MKLGKYLGLGPGHIVLDGDTSPPKKGAQPPIFGPCLLWPNSWMDQAGTWYGDRTQPRQHCVPVKKRGHSKYPTSWTIYCVQTAGWIKMPLGTDVGLGRGHMVLDGDPAPKLQKGTQQHPHFSVRVYCDHTPGWIKMPLDKVVGFGPDHIVLDEDPAPPNKGGTACLLWPNGWMDQDATWCGGRPR